MVTSVARIGAPPLVGAILAVATALVGASLVRFGVGPEAILAAYFSCVLVVLSAIDLERRVLPNRIVVPSTIVVLAARIALEPARTKEWILAEPWRLLFSTSLRSRIPAASGWAT